MKPATILERIRRTPFEPFKMILASGRPVRVLFPDQLQLVRGKVSEYNGHLLIGELEDNATDGFIVRSFACSTADVHDLVALDAVVDYVPEDRHLAVSVPIPKKRSRGRPAGS